MNDTDNRLPVLLFVFGILAGVAITCLTFVYVADDLYHNKQLICKNETIVVVRECTCDYKAVEPTETIEPEPVITVTETPVPEPTDIIEATPTPWGDQRKNPEGFPWIGGGCCNPKPTTPTPTCEFPWWCSE